MERRVLGLLVTVSITLSACISDATPSATISEPPASLAPASSPTPEATAKPTATPLPTPDQSQIPVFPAGAMLATRTVVRLRDLPGTQWGIAANLQAGALVQVVLGPIRTSGFGWYLVRDVDPAAPSFREGWVAAGFAPDAFLAARASATPPPNSPVFIAGYADVTDGDFGPFRLEGSVALRWAIALPTGLPAGSTCRFTGTLTPGTGAPVTFLKTAAAQTPAPGTVQPSFFANHQELRGDLFLHVMSDCSWAVSVVRLPL